MNYLLDTHVLIWAIADKDRLSEKIILILEDPKNEIFVSAISFWEISMKFGLNKLSLENLNPKELPEIATNIGFKLLPLLSEEASIYHQLQSIWHKDPFDRMLITVAIKNNFTLISKDKDIAKYKNEGLKVLW